MMYEASKDKSKGHTHMKIRHSHMHSYIHVYTNTQVECSRIKDLNKAVRELGKEKVDVMTEMKDFRTKIHAINWEIECLEFKAEEVRGPRTYMLARVREATIWCQKVYQNIKHRMHHWEGFHAWDTISLYWSALVTEHAGVAVMRRHLGWCTFL